MSDQPDTRRGWIAAVVVAVVTLNVVAYYSTRPAPPPDPAQGSEQVPPTGGRPSDEGILLLTEEFKPFQYLDESGEQAGFGIELVRLLFAEAKVPIARDTIHIHPWQRAFEMLKSTPNAAAFMTARNARREKQFKWVGPLAARKLWLFRLADRPDINPTTLEEAKAYTVGGYRSAQTDYMQELGFPKLEIVVQEKQNLLKLLNRRVDLVASLELTMAARLRDMGKSYDLVQKAVVLDARFDYALALNRAVPDATVAALQAALDRLRADGTYDRLKDRYLK